jgi:hypothetical protein
MRVKAKNPMIQRPENDGLLVKIDFMCFYLREKMSKKYKA